MVVVYFLVSGAFNAIHSEQLKQQEGRLRQDVEQTQTRYQRLQALKEYLNSDEYIESVAREQLGLVKPGEIGFIAISTVPTPTPVAGEGGRDLWWDELIR